MKFAVATISFLVAFAICDLRFAIAEAPATQATTQPTSQMRQWFADLASRDARKREDARIGLMGLRRDDLSALALLVKESRSLAAAQVAALEEIVTHVYLTGDLDSNSNYGFLGISWNPLTDEPITLGKNDDSDEGVGVLVRSRVPGFCAYRFLQTGDVILAIGSDNAVRVTTFAQIQSIVAATPAGKEITIQLIRQGQTRVIKFPLDAHPVQADQLIGLKEIREAAAEEYWDKYFAPLLGEESM